MNSAVLETHVASVTLIHWPMPIALLRSHATPHEPADQWPAGVRVFLSFDVDYDADLGDRLSAQSQRGGSGFHVAVAIRSRSDDGPWHAGCAVGSAPPTR